MTLRDRAFSGAAGIPGRLFKVLKNILAGAPAMTPSLGFGTLDEDDVALARGWLRDRSRWGDDDVVKRYESEFAAWNGSRHAFAFMGGRVALSAAIHALGLGPSDEVIIPGYTCVVVPNAFDYAGVGVVYGDIELDTYGLDVSRLESRITPNTRAILIQHLYGLVCRDYEQILDLARRRGLRVIEDCAHGTGAEFGGVKLGNNGDVAFYSSEQSKVFTTIQGGVATTNDDRVAQRLAEFQESAPFPGAETIEQQLYNVILNYYQFKHPHRWWRGEIAVLAYGSKRMVSTTEEECRGIRPVHYGRRMPAPIAAIGRNQLGKIDHYNEQRRQGAKRWDDWCDAAGYARPVVIDGSRPIYLRYPVLVEPEKKRDTSWALRELGVTLGVWYVTNVHPAERVVVDCPNADEAVERCINLPTLFF